MISNSKRQSSKSQTTASSTTSGRVSARAKSGSTSSTLQTKGKTQSQEDLTKSKEKTTGRNKTGNGRGASSNRRLAASSKDSSLANRGGGDGKSRDKTAASKTSASSGTTNTKSSTSNSSNNKTSSIAQSRKNFSRSARAESNAAMESQIKDLVTETKSKDSQIKALKQQLDQMMVLLEKNKQENIDCTAQQQQELTTSQADEVDDLLVSNQTAATSSKFSSLVKLIDDDAHLDETNLIELKRLQEENLKLRVRIDEMLILQSTTAAKNQKSEKSAHNKTDDGSSNEEGLSSSMEDIDSAASVDLVIRSSTSVSRSTSTENLLDETNSAASNHYLTLSGLSKCDGNAAVGGGGGGGDDNSESEKVACLTVRIQQMEESHISTNEELEATVQELNDLQKSIPELTIDNDRLKREQHILMERFEASEKKLLEQQTEAEHLRALVSDHLNNDDGNHNDLKQQYMKLLNERRRLLEIQDQLSSELRQTEHDRNKSHDIIEGYSERLRICERDLKQSNTDKIILENKLKDTKELAEEENSNEIQRLKDELKNERQRIDDLIRMRDGSENDDFVEIVDNLRQDKQELEDKYMLLDDEYRDCQHENDKLDARVAGLEEELEATIAKAKKDSSELSELIDHLNDEIRIKDAKLEEASETIFIMEDSVEQQIAVQKHERHTIQQLQNQISNLREERVRLMKEIQQSKKEQRHKTEEWKQFQIDMQMAVSIANDMRAETQAEVAKLREEKQILEDTVTKIRVENEQLRRKRVSSVSMHSAAILEAVNRRQSSSSQIEALHESAHKSRRNAEPSPGVQSLIKSFDSQSGNTTGRSNSTSTSPVTTPVDQQPNNNNNQTNQQSNTNEQSQNNANQFKIQTMKVAPSIATISPIQRHHSLSSISSPTSSSFVTSSTKQQQLQGGAGGSSANSSNSSKTGTPDSSRTGGSDLSQLSSYLRRNSTADTRKPPSSLDVNRSNSTSVSEMLDHRIQQTQQQQSTSTNTTTSTQQASSTNDKQRSNKPTTTSTRGGNGNDPLVTLARKYGGSKRNALLQWCQKKTKDYADIDITNFSTSWSDGLALCALMHSYLPAHIPYNSLVSAYSSANEDRQRKLLQAKHFRLAFAAAESVGIEPTLSVDSMTLKERPDWQSVMYYVTQLYKYFET